MFAFEGMEHSVKSSLLVAEKKHCILSACPAHGEVASKKLVAAVVTSGNATTICVRHEDLHIPVHPEAKVPSGLLLLEGAGLSLLARCAAGNVVRC